MASELIHQAVQAAAAKKPVVVSVAGLAASGGYYIAVGGPTIYADSTSLVGSIGVVTGKLATTETFERIGIATHAITRGKNAGLDLSRPWTDAEIGVVTRHAQTTYDLFVRRVAEGRGERVANVDDIAQGRIFTARQAVDNGMIDHIGGLHDAIQAARKQAGLETSHLISLPKPKTLADLLFNPEGDEIVAPLKSLQFSAESMLLQELLKHRGASYMLNLAVAMRNQTMLTAMPFYIHRP
jgi:protease-4